MIPIRHKKSIHRSKRPPSSFVQGIELEVPFMDFPVNLPLRTIEVFLRHRKEVPARRVSSLDQGTPLPLVGHNIAEMGFPHLLQ